LFRPLSLFSFLPCFVSPLFFLEVFSLTQRRRFWTCCSGLLNREMEISGSSREI
jgi:hypothetical protein